MAGQNNNASSDVNQLLKVRRDKLKELQDASKDPFQITKEKEELFLQLLKRKGWSLSFSEKRKNKRRFLRQ